MEIRSYRRSDAEATALVFTRAVREVAIRDYTLAQVTAWAPDFVWPEDLERWRGRRESRPTWVATLGGEVVGFTDLLATGSLATGVPATGHIDMMFVHPDHQGRGIASALLAHVVQTATAAGLAELTTEGSITARPFFEAHGFHVVSPQLVELRGQSLRNYRMIRRLHD